MSTDEQRRWCLFTSADDKNAIRLWLAGDTPRRWDLVAAYYGDDNDVCRNQQGVFLCIPHLAREDYREVRFHCQPRFRRDHRPPLSTREMAGCPARKSRSTCNCPILRCRSSITSCASLTAGALLPRANNFSRALHQLLFPVADHRRMNLKLRRQLAKVFSPPTAMYRHLRLEFRAVLLPLYAPRLGPLNP